MGRQENSLIRLPAQLMEQLHHFHFTREIKEGSRFVQENHRSFLSQCLGNHHFLSFAITQCMYHAMCQMRYSDQVDSMIHYLFIFFGECSPETGIWTASQTDKFHRSHIADIALLSQDHTDYF